MAQHNPFAGFLEDEPRAGYFSLQSQNPFGRSPNQQNYFQNQFQPIYDEFLGRLGRQIQDTGDQPTLNWMDFLGDFPFQQQYGSLPPSARGDATRRFAPPARFLTGFGRAGF